LSAPEKPLDAHECSNYNVIMKTSLVRIGNSRGIRLPKPVIEQCGFEDEVEMEVHNRELVIRSSSCARDGWHAAFARMGEGGDDELLDRVAESGPTWDEEEWEW
jgi:antitoxin MazE